MLKLPRSVVTVLASVVICLGVIAPVAAAANDTTGSQGIAQSYATDTAIRQGMIVGLKKGDSSKVEPLSKNNISNMQGVAISASDAPITLSGSGSTTQIYVATSGRYDVLVSNQNGPIHSGDYVSISALNGIGMKADDTEPTVLGKAVADFTATNSTEGTATLKNNNGGTTTVVIGSIAVDINVSNNPNEGRGSGNLPGFLQVASNTIANKPVGAPRIYLSLAILLLSALISGSLLYSSVKNGLVAIGRNPLARQSIIRGLLQVILVSIIIFILGLFGVYLLLRL